MDVKVKQKREAKIKVLRAENKKRNAVTRNKQINIKQNLRTVKENAMPELNLFGIENKFFVARFVEF